MRNKKYVHYVTISSVLHKLIRLKHIFNSFSGTSIHDPFFNGTLKAIWRNVSMYVCEEANMRYGHL